MNEIKFSKAEILKMKDFKNYRDLLPALLEDKEYSKSEVSAKIEAWLLQEV